MKKIDIIGWHEFKVGDIFEVSLPKGDNQAQKLEEGDIPLISSGSTNNGIVKLIHQGERNSELYSSGKITVDMFGQSFYHDYDFYAVSHGRVNILTLKQDVDIKDSVGFVLSVLNKSLPQKYGFTTMCSQKRLQAEKIRLPTRQNEQGELEPDWDYMESYMKEVEKKAIDKINSLSLNFQTQKRRVDHTEWREFPVLDIFEDFSHGQRLKKGDRLEGALPFITAGKENKGVSNYIGNTPPEIWKKPVTIDMFGNSFFHNYDCYGDDNVYALLDERLSDFSKMFISSVINTKTVSTFSYISQFRQNNLNSLKISLPSRLVNGVFEPDWQYMEDYMREIERKTNTRIKKLQDSIENFTQKSYN